jgi:hypothetical protein
MTATGSASTCPGAGPGTSFDPPTAWDGSCTANGAIAGGVMCDGGPCVEGLTVASLSLTEIACAPKTLPIPADVTWQTAVYTCSGQTYGRCADSGSVCVPRLPSHSTEFTYCVSQQGDEGNPSCPMDYPKRYVFYVDAEDTRSCSACSCGPPQGSTCSSLITVYSDDLCSAPVASISATSADVMCVTTPAGSALGSKAATPPTYAPGSCQPGGGQVTGSIQPTAPHTFCCRD